MNKLQPEFLSGPRAHPLSSLIGSRICHDLISPIGAISNGVELLSMTDGASGPEMALIEDSVANAGARIRVFRIAFGIADDSVLGPQDMAALMRDNGVWARFALTWAEMGDLSREEAKLICLGILCLETALAFGGTVHLEPWQTGWQLRGQAHRLNVDRGLWQALAAGTDICEVTPATVQFAVLQELCVSTARPLVVETGETEISLRF